MEFIGRKSIAYLGYLCYQDEEWLQETGTRSNPDLMEVMMFRGKGENGLTLWKF
jgi:hypothetical protein